MEREFIKLNITVLAVAEAAGDPTKLVVDRLGEAGHVMSAAPIEDNVQLIRARLLEHIADAGVDVVVVLAKLESESAGVALDPLVTHGLQGFSDLLRMIAYQEIGSAAMLVDAEAARCKSTYVFVVPALPSVVKLALDKLLVAQLDYRTKPRNLVMQLPRIAHVDRRDDAVVAVPVKETTAPMPWITVRAPGEPSVVAPLPSRKSKSMSVAEALPSPSASMSAVLSKVSAAVSVSTQMPVANPFETREPTTQGPPPAPPPLPRGKVSATISAPLPIKPPAKLTSLAPILPVEPPRKMVSLAELDNEGDDLDTGAAQIVAEPPRRDAPISDVVALFPKSSGGATTSHGEAYAEAAGTIGEAPPREPVADRDQPAVQVSAETLIEPPPRPASESSSPVRSRPDSPPPRPASESSSPVRSRPDSPPPRPASESSSPVRRADDSLPPPRRADDSMPPLYDDSPRRYAEPRARRRSGTAVALLLIGMVLAAMTVVLVVVLARKKDREARAEAADHGEHLATRAPAPPPADPPAPIEPPPSEAPPTATPEPKEIEMPAAEADAVAKPSTPKEPRTPKPPRAEKVEAVRDPADVLSAAPVNKVEDGCDEVSCILDKYSRPCCTKYKPAEVEAPPVRPASGLPEKLDKLMVQEGIAVVKPAVIACGERIGVRGTVKIQVKVSASGKVLGATAASSPDPALGTCVANAVKLAKFPETDEGGSFGYPFVF